MTAAISQPLASREHGVGHIPLYIMVSSALLRLASPFFLRIDLGATPTTDWKRDLATWGTLRCTAQLLMTRCALELRLTEAVELREALKRCNPSYDVVFVRGQTFDERG
jgi:hypothetical protein